MTQIHHSRGAYGIGNYKDNGVATDSLEAHIADNIKWRPGRALFIDGVCRNQGYLSVKECAEITLELQNDPVIMQYDTHPYQ